MINSYVQKLIENLPDDLKNRTKPLKLDIVLDGGAFNGNYLVGALYFLKEMEKRKYIIIDRISGSSIGSFVGILYFIDKLDYMTEFNRIALNNFKSNFSFNKSKYILGVIKRDCPIDICEKINNRLFISYNNVNKTKKCVKSIYKNVDEIFETILKSCFIPFCINGNMVYKGKYIDGITPYIFKKCAGKRVLYLNLLGLDKINNIINVKNEKNNYNR